MAAYVWFLQHLSISTEMSRDIKQWKTHWPLKKYQNTAHIHSDIYDTKGVLLFLYPRSRQIPCFYTAVTNEISLDQSFQGNYIPSHNLLKCNDVHIQRHYD